MTGDKEKYILDIHWFGIQDKVKFYLCDIEPGEKEISKRKAT